MIQNSDAKWMYQPSLHICSIPQFYHLGSDLGSCGDPAYHCMCSMQVVDITPMKHHLTSITSIRVVQQKYRRSKVCL
jgi:hypothetical protein